MALSQLLPNHLIGANVHTVKQPDITVIRNARTAKVSAIYSWARALKQRFGRLFLDYAASIFVLAQPRGRTNIRVDYSAYVERSKQASSTRPISFFSPTPLKQICYEC